MINDFLFREWRGFNIEKRCRKLERAFNLEPVKTPEDFPIVINTPCYFGFGNDPLPWDYWVNPASMVSHQEKGFEKHLSMVDDDTIPYFMPWFGTGVLASAFGCTVKEATGFGDDPGIVSTCIETVSDIGRLKIPDPHKDGQMPVVLQFMEYARKYSDLPVGLTDINSPLCTAAQICGYDKLFVWMYEEPDAVHELMNIVTEALIFWVRTQKQYNGEPLDASNGLQGVWSPKGTGIWLSDDDLVSVGPAQYEEFIVPYYSRIFEVFGGGRLHFCGKGTHQQENLLKIRNIKAINNSPMGDFKTFGKLACSLQGKLALQIQDAAPYDVEGYYPRLLDQVDDLSGLMLATFVEDNLALTNDGGTIAVDWDPIDTSNRIVRTIRECVGKKLAGKPLYMR